MYNIDFLFESSLFWLIRLTIRIVNAEKKAQRPPIPSYISTVFTAPPSSRQLTHSQGHIMIMEDDYCITYGLFSTYNTVRGKGTAFF